MIAGSVAAANTCSAPWRSRHLVHCPDSPQVSDTARRFNPATAAGAAVAAAAAAAPVGAQPAHAAADGGAASVAEACVDISAVEGEQPPAGGPQPLPARHCSSMERSPWADLQPELLAVVLAQAGKQPVLTCALGGCDSMQLVHRGWPCIAMLASACAKHVR